MEQYNAGEYGDVMSAYGHLYGSLRTDWNRDMYESSMEHMVQNIMTFASLDRVGLSYSGTERRVLLHTTGAGEEVFIQYPGKESARPGDKCRPWDFRPKVRLPTGHLLPDLSFSMFFRDMDDLHHRDPESTPVMAAILFRMAGMLDHRFVDGDYPSEIVRNRSIACPDVHVRIPYHRYTPPMEVVNLMQKRIGNIGGMSIEAYLLVCEYISANEDCKYYYRGDRFGGRRWGDGIGRVNNLLTYLSVLAGMQGYMDRYALKSLIDARKHVRPIDPSLVERTTGGLVRIAR